MLSGKRIAAPIIVASALLLSACGGSSGSGGGSKTAPAPGCDDSLEFCGQIPLNTDPCTETDQFWPFEVKSGQRPFNVHYPRLGYRDTALAMIDEIEKSWARQVDELGFAPPQKDGGLCGANGRYDVFIWPGIDGAFVNSVAENSNTLRDDYSTYMAINVGSSSNPELSVTTIAHEFNHAVQASDDWWESALFFEMSATFVESLVYPDLQDYFFTLRNFQARPQWSLFYNDNYETWYMYGASMYLHFLSERYFPDDPAFIARIWRETRSDPALGRPDYIDALRTTLLNDRGVDLDDSIVEFMQWRWFVAEFDDGAHFLHGAEWPRGVAFEDIDAADAPLSVELSAMLYGAHYVRIGNSSGRPRILRVDLQTLETDARWRLTTVQGEEIAGTLTVDPAAFQIIVATPLPDKPISSVSLSYEPRTAVLELSEM